MSDFLYNHPLLLSDVFKFIISIIPLIIAIVLHELSHGLAAYVLGDNSAKEAKRLNLYNHFDFYGSFVIPLSLYLLNSPFLIGYAKPVPVNPLNFKRPLRDMAIVAIAGPACNLLLALIGSCFLNTFDTNLAFTEGRMLTSVCHFITLNFVVINLGLFFFNLIPIPPLDGSRILATFLPKSMLYQFYKYEPLGFFIIFGLEMLTRMAFGDSNSFFHILVHKPITFVLNHFLI